MELWRADHQDIEGGETRPAMATILVVEDENLVAKDIQNTLVRLGYKVAGVVSSGEDAVRRVEQARPDLVLMDIMLKGEMDGVQAARVMRDRFNVPVVYLTAYADDDSLERARLAEPFGYLLKPFNQKELRSAIEVALYKHQMELRLREREHWFSTTLKSIGDAVIAVDAANRVTFMNRAAEGLTEWTMEEAVGRPLDQVYRVTEAEGAPQRLPAPSLLGRSVIPGLGGLLTGRAGRKVSVEESVAPIADGDNTVLGAVVVFRDITERKKLQDSLANADRLASLGTMAAGIAHEINNPLTFVVGNVGFATEELADLTRALELGVRTDGGVGMDAQQLIGRLNDVLVAMKEAARGSERVRVIVDDLRVFSRSESRVRKRVDVQDALEFSIKMANNQIRHRARLVRDYQPVPGVQANESHLCQVFINLLVNAAQAIEEGNAQGNEIRVLTRAAADGRVVVEVRDTGQGIPADLRRRIFDPFFTTKPVGVGTGLGLSISHRIITELGGQMDVHSEVGKGSVFRVMLPAAEPLPGVEQKTAPQPEPKKEGNRARILVVDDEEMVGTTIRRALMGEHEVELVSSALAALKKLSAGETYDVILCDLMMPQMTGMDLYDELVQANPEQAERMLFLSGGAFTERAQAIMEQFPKRCLKKPFEPKNLRTMVREFLQEHAPDGAKG